jgi:hypothetical protein
MKEAIATITKQADDQEPLLQTTFLPLKKFIEKSKNVFKEVLN